jgi:hypothetical protein
VQDPESLEKIVTDEEICVLQYESVSECHFSNGGSQRPKEGEVQNLKVPRPLIFCFQT